jgi:hypothetical protein
VAGVPLVPAHWAGAAPQRGWDLMSRLNRWGRLGGYKVRVLAESCGLWRDHVPWSACFPDIMRE